MKKIKIAIDNVKKDVFFIKENAICAVAIREDGTIVKAYNGYDRLPAPSAHAEARVIRKAGYGAIIFVARIKKSKQIGNCKPCPDCEIIMRNYRVKKCYYTIDNSNIGIINFKKKRSK